MTRVFTAGILQPMRNLVVWVVLVVTSCGGLPPIAGLSPESEPQWCQDAANARAVLDSMALPYPLASKPTSFNLCPHDDGWTFFPCALCYTSAGALLVSTGSRCKQDTGRSPAPPLDAPFVVCVYGCSDPVCQY